MPLSISGLGRVYTLNPAFRADRNLSRFHLAEFWMLEVEVAGKFTVNEEDQSIEEFISSMDESFMPYFVLISQSAMP